MRRQTAKILLTGREKRLYDSLYALTHDVVGDEELDLRFANSFKAALAEIEREKYDACLVDDELGVRRLPELALAARRQGYDLPLIFLAGEDAFGAASEALKGGATDFLIKEQLTPATLARSLRYARERALAQEALYESEKRYRDLVENANDIIYTHGLEGTILSFNKAGERITGYTREEAIGMTVAEIVAPDYLDLVRRMTARRLAGEVPAVYELEIVARDGRRVRLEVNSRLVYEKDQPVHIEGVARDVTERRHAEEALLESEGRNRVIMETASDAIITIDEESTIRFVNPAAEKIFGYAVAELTGAKLTTLIPDYLRHAHLVGMKRYRETGERHITWEAFEAPGLHKDGREIPLEISFGEYERDGTHLFTAIIRDISERKRAREAVVRSEEQLLQSQKMEAIGRLAGGVAHDFNNLLTAITGYSDLSLRRLKEGDPVHRNIGEIKKAAERAADLTRQLLTFSRKQVLQPKVLDLNAVVAEMEKMLRRLIGEDVLLVVNLGQLLGHVKADPGQLEQVLMNLVVNARDAMPGGGTLTIQTENARLDDNDASQDAGLPPGPYALLSISDTGHGMNAETRRRVFEPFFTTKEKGKGTGLGLSTVYGIVTQSGGSIRVNSEPSLGTTFNIYLPLVLEAIEAVGPSPGETEIARGSETILLVEDDRGVREMMREILEMCGYHVLMASCGGEAVRICEGYQGMIELLLTDVVMPHLSGKELADALTLLRPRMKVLYISGYTDDAIIHHGVLDEEVAFLQKPFAPSTLAHKLRELLDPRRETVHQ